MTADFIKASKYKVPNEVSRVTQKLKKAGYEAFLVGGCVRDMLRNAKPKDWDITTNADPETINSLFEHSFYENRFGTVSIVNEETTDDSLHVVEVTPYRTEGRYSDKRRPDTVQFSQSIDEDLKRRDFTINAIAYDDEKDIYYDPYNGRADIKDKIIRTVGNPKDRFGEDALRMLRAVRLHAELGFYIDNETKDGVSVHAEKLANIAVERIRDEFIRITASPYPKGAIEMLAEIGLLRYIIPELEESFHVKQNQAHSYDVWEHLLRSLQHAADKNWPLEVRIAALLHDIGKPATKQWDEKKQDWSFHGHEVVGAKITRKALKRLTFSNELITRVTTLIRWHMFFSDPDQITLSAVRRMVRNVGKDNVWDLVHLRICDRIGTGRPKEEPYRLRKYESMIEEAMRSPVTVQNLAIDGSDLMNNLSLKPGPIIGFLLHALLEEVLDDPDRNTSNHLLERAEKLSNLPLDELKERGEQGKQKREKEEEKQLKKIRRKYGVK